MTSVSFAERVFWHTHSYGRAVRIKRASLRLAATALCLFTFGTNWLIPFIPKLITRDWVLRYE